MKLLPRPVKLPPKIKRLPWQTITAAAGTVALLLFCAWLPGRYIKDLEISPAPATVQPTDNSVLVELWTAYRAGALTAKNFEADSESQEACKELATEVRSRLTLDIGGDRRTASGEECLSVGGRLRLYHCWGEWSGDWSNWLEIFINMDTREIYYFYISSSCQKNFERYTNALSPGFDTEAAAKLWGETLGLGEAKVSWSGNPEDPAVAAYRDITYQISAKYYFDASYPTGLFDLKVVVM